MHNVVLTGFKPIKVHVSSFPEGGMTILNTHLRNVHFDIKPEVFIQGARANLEKVANNIIGESNYKPEIATDWTEFLQKAPATDNVQEYVASLPDGLHVPLRDVLFLGHPVPVNADAPAALLGNEPLEEFRAVASVGHTGQRAVAAQDRVTRVPLNEAPAPPQAEQPPQAQQEVEPPRVQRARPAQVPPVPALAAPSAYEQIRLDNIARNKAFLQNIGLDSTRNALRFSITAAQQDQQPSLGKRKRREPPPPRQTLSRHAKDSASIRITTTTTSSTNHDNDESGEDEPDNDAPSDPYWFADISLSEGLAICTKHSRNKKKLHEKYVGMLLVDDVEDDEGNQREEARIIVGIEWRTELKDGDGEPLPNQYLVVTDIYPYSGAQNLEPYFINEALIDTLKKGADRFPATLPEGVPQSV